VAWAASATFHRPELLLARVRVRFLQPQRQEPRRHRQPPSFRGSGEGFLLVRGHADLDGLFLARRLAMLDAGSHAGTVSKADVRVKELDVLCCCTYSSNMAATEPVDSRQARGLALVRAQRAKIKHVAGSRWLVPSQTNASGGYVVDVEQNSCSCPDH